VILLLIYKDNKNKLFTNAFYDFYFKVFYLVSSNIKNVNKTAFLIMFFFSIKTTHFISFSATFRENDLFVGFSSNFLFTLFSLN
jgi:hypothetical protein